MSRSSIWEVQGTRKIASRYRAAAPNLRWQSPHERHVYHLCVARTTERDAFRSAAPFETGVHYPVPLPRQPVYAGLGYESADFPVAEAAAASSLSLPMHPWVARAVDRVVEALADAVDARRPR